MAEPVTADPATIRVVFARFRCLNCQTTLDGAFWEFDDGLTLRLRFPDESQRRYTHEWHIGVTDPADRIRPG